jgi:iron complex outermembrane receptor protein
MWPTAWCRATLVFLAAACPEGVNAAPVSPGELADLSIEELSNLQVTSVSRRPESLGLTAASIYVITAEDIRRSAATRLPEALRLAPNLQVAQITGDAWAISARGFNSALANKLLVMIDGRTIYSPLFAGTFWEAHNVPLYDVERIEVISGPGGTLWGANAVNGIINVVTRSARETHGWLARARAGDELRGQGALRYGGTLGDDIHYRVYGQYAERDATLLADGSDAGDDSDLGQLGFRVDWNSSEQDSFTFQGDVGESHTGRPAFGEARSQSRNVRALWQHAWSETSDLRVQASYDRADRDVPGQYTDVMDTFDFDFQHHMRGWPGHEVVWGLTYRSLHDDFGNVLFAMDPASVSLDRFGGFIQDEIRLIEDRLHVTVGTKVEDNEYTGTEWQPSAALAWRFRTGQFLWASVARAVRTPSRFERDLANATTPPFTVGSDAFRSEELTAYEIGLKARPFATLAVSVATYFNRYDRLRSFEPTLPAGTPLVISNELEGDSRGIEITADYAPDPRYRFRLGYSYLDLDLDPKPGSLDPTQGSVEAQDWKHQLFLRGTFDLPGDWELDGRYRYISEIEIQGTPGYSELELRLGWRAAPSLDFALVGKNLLHSSHAEFGGAGRQEFERQFFAEVTWRSP